jgi:Arc/MetJ-type ribon-helix-helix transcriptional regulator
MKDYIVAKLREGRFSTPSEYIRSLIRDEQDLAAAPRPALAARRGLDSKTRPPVKRKK